MRNKNSNIESLKDIFNLDFDSNTILKQSDLDNYKNNLLFKDSFPLSDDEVIYNIAYFDNIIDNDQKCKVDKEDNCPTNGYHLQVRRNPENLLLSFYYLRCKKVAKLTAMKEKQKNILFSSYPLTKNFIDIHSEKTTTKSKNDFLKIFFDIWKTKSNKGIYIYGTPGVGKTYLFKMISSKIVVSSDDVKIGLIFIPDMVETIKSSFSKPSSNLNKMNDAIKNADFLFLDDIGAEFASDWFYSNNFLSMLNLRIESNKPTFFNSNLSLKEYENKIANSLKSYDKKVIASRVVDRIRRLVGNNILQITDEKYGI